MSSSALAAMWTPPVSEMLNQLSGLSISMITLRNTLAKERENKDKNKIINLLKKSYVSYTRLANIKPDIGVKATFVWNM